MRQLLDILGVFLAIMLGMPIYLEVLPYSAAFGAVFLGTALIALPLLFRRAYNSSRQEIQVPDYPPNW